MGNMTYTFSQFITLSMLAKFGSALLVADWALAMAIASPLMIFSNLKLRQVLATDAKREFPIGVYLATRMCTLGLAVLVLVLGALLGPFEAGFRPVLIGVTIAKAGEAMSDLSNGLFIKSEELKWMARSQFMRGVVLMAAILLGVGVANSLAYGMCMLAFGWWCVAALDHHKARQLAPEEEPWWPEFNLGRVLSVVRVAIPLGLVTMFGNLQRHVPRYFLEIFVSHHAVGIYSGLAYLMAAGNMVMQAVCQATIPRLAKYYAGGNRAAFLWLLARMVALGLTMGAVALVATMAIGGPVLNLIFGPEFAEHVDVLVLIAIAAAISWAYVNVGTAINAMRQYWIQFPIHLCNLAVVTVAGFFLIRAYGLHGAAMALICSAVAVLVLNSIVVAWAINQPPEPREAT
jgi:O-antigen/teichoic acid export membrane protein